MAKKTTRENSGSQVYSVIPLKLTKTLWQGKEPKIEERAYERISLGYNGTNKYLILRDSMLQRKNMPIAFKIVGSDTENFHVIPVTDAALLERIADTYYTSLLSRGCHICRDLEAKVIQEYGYQS